MAQSLWGFTLIVLSHSPDAAKEGLELMRASAKAGCVPAMVNLGYLLERGRHVRRDYNEAIHWFETAAEQGNAEAQLQLGGCYQYGLGATPDFAAAAKYYRLAAGQTNYVAMKSLGYLLMNGLGVATNEIEAKYWLLRAANEGANRRAMFDLGCWFSEKFPDTNALTEAFQWTKKSAELGDALAADSLASFYYRGWGVAETNLALYHIWRLKAALWGCTDAQFFMGQAYRTGDGVPVDAENSLLWYRRAAAKNHPGALYDLALRCLADKTNRASLLMANELMLRAARMGHREAQFQCAMSDFRGDVLFDYDGGREWLAKAAASGWPRAEFCLFQLFYYGISPATNCPAYPKDKTEAIKWLRRAAEHGNLQAQSTLAVMLIRGGEIAPDKAAAGKLLRAAAIHGFAPAENDLGFAILEGDIAPLDPVEAAVWCKLATLHTTNAIVSKRAAENLAVAISRLSVEQQHEVENRVRQFKAVPIPELDPLVMGWERNPDYQREDGPYGH